MQYYIVCLPTVLKGDLADERTEAIVNNANENLCHGGGVCIFEHQNND